MEHFRKSISEILPSVFVDAIPNHLQSFVLFTPKELIKEVVIPHKKYNVGGGLKTYPWRVLGIDRSMILVVNHSRFSAPFFLEQHNNWSLWYGSILIQVYTSLNTFQGNIKATHHQWKTTTRTKGSILGVEADGLCAELQNFHPYISLVWMSKLWSRITNAHTWYACLCHTNNDHLVMRGIQFPDMDLVFHFVLIQLKVRIKQQNAPKELFRER